MKINSWNKQNHAYLTHTWTDKAFESSIVNQAMPSLHGGSLEVVHLNKSQIKINDFFLKYALLKS